MAQYTSNIGLHQWEPSDHFLRTDFNQDFAKIDGAFGQCGTVQGWLEDTAARIGHEALQCRLSADLEGKICPPGRGLIFNSLRSLEHVTLGGGCWEYKDGGVVLDIGSGLVDFESNFGSGIANTLKITTENASASCWFTAAGSGTLNTLQLYLRGTTNGPTAIVRILDGTKILWEGRKENIPNSIQMYSFTPGLQVKKGVRYTIFVTRSIDSIYVYRQESGTQFGFRGLCTPAAGASGTITTDAQSFPAFRGARAWVRHTAGTAECAIQRNGGGFVSMQSLGTRASVDIRGNVCMETEFSMPAAAEPSGGEIQLRVGIRNSGTDAVVGDFGVALL
jgi:hypothetical protein